VHDPFENRQKRHTIPRCFGGTVFADQEPHNPYKIADVVDLLAPCWCGRSMKPVSRKIIREGKTFVCGHNRCKEAA
jgi:hypothetical protein